MMEYETEIKVYLEEKLTYFLTCFPMPMFTYDEEIFDYQFDKPKFIIKHFINSIKITETYKNLLISEWHAISFERPGNEPNITDQQIKKKSSELKNMKKIALEQGNISQEDAHAIKFTKEKIISELELEYFIEEFESALRNDIVCLLAMKLAEYCYQGNFKISEKERKIFTENLRYDSLEEIISVLYKKKDLNNISKEEFLTRMKNIIEINCIPEEVWPICTYIVYRHLKKYNKKKDAQFYAKIGVDKRGDEEDNRITKKIIPYVNSTPKAVEGHTFFSYMLDNITLGNKSLNAYIFDQYTSFYDMQYYFSKYNSLLKDIIKYEQLYNKFYDICKQIDELERKNNWSISIGGRIRMNYMCEETTNEENKEESNQKKDIMLDHIFSFVPIKAFFVKHYLVKYSLFTSSIPIREYLEKLQECLIENVNKQIDNMVNSLFERIQKKYGYNYNIIMTTWFKELSAYIEKKETILNQNNNEFMYANINKQFLDLYIKHRKD